MKRVGVLALQGDFEAHGKAVERAGGTAIEVRTAEDLRGLDGLIIPGGESTTIGKLMTAYDLLGPLRRLAAEGFPIYGSCAGMILLADRVLGGTSDQVSVGGIDMTVRRNAFGRQVDSWEGDLDFGGEPVHGVFIRAPIIRRVGDGARVLAWYDGDPVLVEEGRHVVATFHPELSGDSRVHELFLQKLNG